VLASHKNKDPANGNQPVLKSGHGEDGQLGFVFQGQHSQQPPTPYRTTGVPLGKTRPESNLGTECIRL